MPFSPQTSHRSEKCYARTTTVTRRRSSHVRPQHVQRLLCRWRARARSGPCTVSTHCLAAQVGGSSPHLVPADERLFDGTAPNPSIASPMPGKRVNQHSLAFNGKFLGRLSVRRSKSRMQHFTRDFRGGSSTRGLVDGERQCGAYRCFRIGITLAGFAGAGNEFRSPWPARWPGARCAYVSLVICGALEMARLIQLGWQTDLFVV
jgi:hypothetical protein